MLFKANHTTPTEGDRALAEARSIAERRARQEEQISTLIQSLESQCPKENNHARSSQP